MMIGVVIGAAEIVLDLMVVMTASGPTQITRIKNTDPLMMVMVGPPRILPPQINDPV